MSDTVRPLSYLDPPFPKNLHAEAARVLQLQHELRSFERLDRRRQDSLLSAQLRQLIAHAKRYAPFWSERINSQVPDARSAAETMTGVPVLTRSDLQSRQKEIAADFPQRKNVNVSHTLTSGSTGTPVRVEHLATMQRRINQVAVLLTARWHGIDPNKSFGTLLGNAEDGDDVPLSAPFSWFGPVSSGFSRCTMHREHDELYELCALKNPSYLYCGPEPAVGLALYAIRSGRRDFRPEAALTIGSTVTAEMRDVVREGLGAKIVDNYLAQETSIIAIQCPKYDHHHVISPISMVEIVDEQDRPCPAGRPGRVLVTSMKSFAMPLLRYEIGDTAEWGEPCDCGITLPVIGKLWGRTSRIFVNPDGRKTYAKIYARAFDDVDDLIEYRFVLHQNKMIDAQLRVRKPSPEIAASVTETVQKALSYPYPVKIRFVDKIDWGLSWKKENFEVSNAPPP
jgi:phenylacetate-CoA ligase